MCSEHKIILNSKTFTTFETIVMSLLLTEITKIYKLMYLSKPLVMKDMLVWGVIKVL